MLITCLYKQRLRFRSSTKASSLGFSLVELMVGIAIMAILLSVAVPSFISMLKNIQIRNAAESVLNGIQKARAEAVARNTNVSFVLGADAAGTYTSWTVNVVNPVSQIASRNSKDGSIDVTRSVLPANATTITYNNLGGVVAAANQLARVNFAAISGTKTLSIRVGAGGNVRMCDPGLVAGSNARAC